jgi:hypothetical protein
MSEDAFLSPETVREMTASIPTRQLLAEIRNRGWAVTAFGPEDEPEEGYDFADHGGFAEWLAFRAERIEDRMAEQGNETMNQMMVSDGCWVGDEEEVG